MVQLIDDRDERNHQRGSEQNASDDILRGNVQLVKDYSFHSKPDVSYGNAVHSQVDSAQTDDEAPHGGDQKAGCHGILVSARE